ILWNQLLVDQRAKKISSQVKESEVTLPDKYVFLPLQVEDDTQILLNSSFSGMDELMRVVYPAVISMNNYKLVVKEHPHDWGRHNQSTLRERYPKAIWLQKYPTEQVITGADIVVTVNSSVGVEALLLNKKVITLGKCFYDVDGVAWKADKNNFSSILSEALATH